MPGHGGGGARGQTPWGQCAPTRCLGGDRRGAPPLWVTGCVSRVKDTIVTNGLTTAVCPLVRKAHRTQRPGFHGSATKRPKPGSTRHSRGHSTAQPPVPCAPQDPGALLPWESALGAGRALLPAQPPCLAPQVRIALQLDDGSRLQDTFCLGQTLWELLSHFPQTRRVSGVLAVPPAVVLV